MNSKAGKNKYVMLLCILAGIVIGGFIAEYLPNSVYFNWLKYGQVFGTSSPFVLDLGIISFTFGFMLKINIAGILGIVLSLIIYRRL